MPDQDSDRERKIANVLETYFSDANLMWDKLLLRAMNSDPEGFVSFEELAKLRRFKAVNAQASEIKGAAEQYSLSKLRLDDDGSCVARIKPFVLNKTIELEAWSVYVEGLRPPYNTVPAIKALFERLVGHVAFVRIPKDRKGSDHFKGFCFVEFTHSDHVAAAVTLLNRYPQPASSNDTALKEAIKLSLRVMTKTDWLRFETEYLAHRARVVERIYPPAYPKGVIVDVTNIHPKSSKTVLKQLLETSGELSIEFINRKKGQPRCHVRLATPEDTRTLVKYFDAHPVIQEHGTDAKGSSCTGDNAMRFRVREIKGKEEEIYWEEDQEGLAQIKAHPAT